MVEHAVHAHSPKTHSALAGDKDMAQKLLRPA
jgi:hypothetical protein